jgi:AcrR family transcriptional regulator
MAVLTSTDAIARPNRGGRPRDPSRDGVIRKAILRLLADVGYGALTMDAVAARAGVGKATIYRRWRTKEDLVVDTIAGLEQKVIDSPDTGTVEGDLRSLMHTLVAIINGPLGAATLALLSTVPHQPALAEAFRSGPIAVWRTAFDEVWARGVERGEISGSAPLASETTSALLVQRWLLTRQPVDEAFADEVLQGVVVPMLRTTFAGAGR